MSSKSSSSSGDTYLSILKRRKTNEQVDEVIKAGNKAALVELERKHDEDIALLHSTYSVKEQLKNSLLLYDDLKNEKYSLLDSKFKSFENNDAINTSKFVKSLLDQKSNSK